MVVLDDLQWSDDTTLELLAALAAPLREMPVLVIGAYRSDGLPREHRLRWLRNELRRDGQLEEISLEPLDRDGVEALLGELLPEEPSPSLARTVHDRTLGSPFFVEELVAALRARGSLRSGRRGLELADEDEVPVPDIDPRSGPRRHLRGSRPRRAKRPRRRPSSGRSSTSRWRPS